MDTSEFTTADNLLHSYRGTKSPIEQNFNFPICLARKLRNNVPDFLSIDTKRLCYLLLSSVVSPVHPPLSLSVSSIFGEICIASSESSRESAVFMIIKLLILLLKLHQIINSKNDVIFDVITLSEFPQAITRSVKHGSA